MSSEKIRLRSAIEDSRDFLDCRWPVTMDRRMSGLQSVCIIAGIFPPQKLIGISLMANWISSDVRSAATDVAANSNTATTFQFPRIREFATIWRVGIWKKQNWVVKKKLFCCKCVVAWKWQSEILFLRLSVTKLSKFAARRNRDKFPA